MQFLYFFRWLMTHPLNSRTLPGRINAFLRFARWQIASRLIPAPIALPFVDETLLLVSNGMTGATGNWYCGLHEPAEMGFVLHALQPGELFIDVGANIGSYSVISSGAIGAHVIAIEPIPETFKHLETNIVLNGQRDNAELLNIGLSTEEGTLRFTQSLDTMNRILAPGEELDFVSIIVKPLDAIVDGRSPHMIKIDVEGHELPVLRGAPKTLSNPTLRAVILETNSSGRKYGISDQDVFDEMRKYGFAPYNYDSLRRELTAASPLTSKNTIFLRDAHGTRARCKSARRFKLVNGTI